MGMDHQALACQTVIAQNVYQNDLSTQGNKIKMIFQATYPCQNTAFIGKLVSAF